MNKDEKSFDELCCKLRTLGIEYTDGETTELSSIPQPLGEPANVLAEGPFFWKPTNEEVDKLYIPIFISKAKEDEDDSYDLRKFSIYLALAYELYLSGNTVLAKNVIDKIESNINTEFTPIPDAVRCVFNSCKGYLLEKLGKHEEAMEAFKVLEDKEKMDDKNKAILLAIKSYVYSQYGYEGMKKALIYAKEALKLEPTSAEWNFIAGKYMGRLRHIEESYTVPSKEEMVYLEKASQCTKNSSYMVYTAQNYRETSSRICSKYGKNLNETIRSHIEVLNSKAADMFKKSAKLGSNNASILFRCANGLMKLSTPHRDLNTAWKLLFKALEMSPGNLYGCHTAAQYFMKYEPNPMEARKYLKICTDNNVFGAYMDVICLEFSESLGKGFNFEHMFALLLVNFPMKYKKIETYLLMAEYYSLVKFNVVKAYEAISNIMELDPYSVQLRVYRPRFVSNELYSPVHLLLHDLENEVKIDSKNLALNQINKTFKKKVQELELDITRKPENSILAVRLLFKKDPEAAVRNIMGNQRSDRSRVGVIGRGRGRDGGRGSRRYNNNSNNRQINSNNQQTESNNENKQNSMRGGRGRRWGNWSRGNFGNKGARKNDTEGIKSNNESSNIGLEKKTIPSLLGLNFQNNTKQDRDFKTNEAMRDKPNVQTGGQKNKFHPAIPSYINRSDHTQLGVQDRSGRNVERKESDGSRINNCRNKTKEQYKGLNIRSNTRDIENQRSESGDRRRDQSKGPRRRSYSDNGSNSHDRRSEWSMDSRRRYHRHTRGSSRDSRRNNRDRKRDQSMGSRRRYHRYNRGSSRDSRSSRDRKREKSMDSRRRYHRHTRESGSDSQRNSRDRDRKRDHFIDPRGGYHSYTYYTKRERSRGSHKSNSIDKRSERSTGLHGRHNYSRSPSSRRRHDHRNSSRDRESIRSIGSRRRSRKAGIKVLTENVNGRWVPAENTKIILEVQAATGKVLVHAEELVVRLRIIKDLEITEVVVMIGKVVPLIRMENLAVVE